MSAELQSGGENPADPTEGSEAQIASSLAEYMDLLGSGGQVDVEQFVSSPAGIRPKLAEALRTVESVWALARRSEEPVLKRFGEFRILREAERGGMGIV